MDPNPGNLWSMSEEQVVEFFKDYQAFIKKYRRYETVGYALLGLTIGNLVSNAIIPVVTDEPRTRSLWLFASLSTGTLIYLVTILCLVRRTLKHHVALHDSLLETFKVEPGSLRFFSALEQADAALTKLHIKRKNDSDISIS